MDPSRSLERDRRPSPPIEDLTVSGASEEERHVWESLGLYLLGALIGRERDVVEWHLARCPSCCAEANDLGAVVDALALLPEQDVQELIAESGLAGSTAPPPAAPGPALPPGTNAARATRPSATGTPTPAPGAAGPVPEPG
jgi:hypothetical protein